jgi:hypothetical protein
MGIQGIIPLRRDVKGFWQKARAKDFNQTVDVATDLSLDVLTESSGGPSLIVCGVHANSKTTATVNQQHPLDVDEPYIIYSLVDEP